MIDKVLIEKVALILVGKVFTAVAGFFLFVILAKYLSINDLGVYVFSISVCTIISMTSNWGTNEYLFRECSAFPSKVKGLMRIARLWKLVLASILGCFFVLYLQFEEWSQRETLVAVLMLLAYICDAQSMSYIMIRRSLGDNKTEAVFFSIRSFMKLLVVYLVVSAKGNFTDIVIAILTVNFFGMIFLWIKYQIHIKLNFSELSSEFELFPLLKKMTPYALFTFIGALYAQNGQILSNVIGGKEITAIYGVGIQFYQVAIFLPVAVNIAIQPALTRLYEKDSAAWSEKIRKIFKAVALFSIISGGVLYVIVPELLVLFFDDRYLAAKSIIEICMLAFVFRFISSSIVGTMMISANKVGLYNYILVPVLIVNIVLNIILIEKMGAVGAAVSLLVSEILMVVFGSAIGLYVLNKEGSVKNRTT